MTQKFRFTVKAALHFVLGIALYSSVTPLYGKTLNARLDSLTAVWNNIPGLKPAQWGISIWDAKQMREIAGKNQNLLLIPASTQKILTSFAALEVFGPQYQFTTTVAYSGQIDTEGSLLGDLIIVGGGDPSLGSRRFAATNSQKLISAITAEVIKAGIRNIKGNIIADASLFGLPFANWSWSWEDLGAYYGAGASALSFRDNYAQLYVRPGTNATTWDFSWEKPEPAGIEIEIALETVPAKGKNQIRILGTEFQNTRILTGTVRSDEKQIALRVSLPNPALALAQAIHDALSEKGIAVHGTTNAIFRQSTQHIETTTITKINSPALTELIAEVNKESNNLFAEHLFKNLGVKSSGKGNSETGKESLRDFWLKKGLSERELNIEDGSGLSRYNAISAGNLSKALAIIATSKFFPEFLASLPRSGTEGTLKNVGTAPNQKGKIWAKSGSMSKVRAYAGYTYQPNGDLICFALLINQHTLSGKELKDLTESFWNLLLT